MEPVPAITPSQFAPNLYIQAIWAPVPIYLTITLVCRAHYGLCPRH